MTPATLLLLVAVTQLPDGGVLDGTVTRRAPGGRVVVEQRFRQGRPEGRFATWYANGVKRSEGQFTSAADVSACRDRNARSGVVGGDVGAGCRTPGERVGRWRAWAPDGGVVFDQTLGEGRDSPERSPNPVAIAIEPEPRAPAEDVRALEGRLVAHARTAASVCSRQSREPAAWGPLELTFQLELSGPAGRARLFEVPPYLPPEWGACFEQRFAASLGGTWHGSARVRLTLIVTEPLPGPPVTPDCDRQHERFGCEQLRGCRWGIIPACPGCMGGREGCVRAPY